MKKVDFILNKILSLDPVANAAHSVMFGKVLSNLSEVNDKETFEKLDAIEKKCFKNFTLLECKELYDRYFSISFKQNIEYKGEHINIMELKQSFWDLYGKVLDYVFNMDFLKDYHIGTDGKEDEIFAKFDAGIEEGAKDEKGTKKGAKDAKGPKKV